MLRIKFFPEFIADQPYIVIAGSQEAYRRASQLLRERKAASLNDPEIFSSRDFGALTEAALRLDRKECIQLSRHFKRIAGNENPKHVYFDTKSLDSAAEVLISYKEYDNLL